MIPKNEFITEEIFIKDSVTEEHASGTKAGKQLS